MRTSAWNLRSRIKKEAMHDRSLVSVKVEPCSTSYHSVKAFVIDH